MPVRQWVLSLPHAVRFLMARDTAVLALCRGVFARAVQSFYIRRTRDQGHGGGRTGSVVCVQRFDSALRLDLHFHALVLDGVYTGFGTGEKLVFREAAPLCDDEVEQLARHIRNLITGRLQRMGLLDADARLDPDTGRELDALGSQHAAAIQGVIRLAAQVPPPRMHMLSYFGVLAAAAARRDQIVPGNHEPRPCTTATHPTKPPPRPRPERTMWAELLRRTFLVDVLACPCGGRRRVLSLVCDPAQIYRCLTHLGLPTHAPARAPPRDVEQPLGFGGS